MGKLQALKIKQSSLTESTAPKDIAVTCRHILQGAIELIYEDAKVNIPTNATMLELLDSDITSSFLGDRDTIQAFHFVRILGMNAEHGKKIKKREAEIAQSNTDYLLSYITDKKLKPAEGITYKKPVYMSEAETRKIYIDTYLEEAGWEVMANKDVKSPGKASIEIQVDGMPNGQGIGFCDYVLYGRDGKPLAIVEAKKTSADPSKGRHQVDLYGECMRTVYGYKPVLYYTNGYSIKVIDGIYPDRKVAAFHTIDELELMLQRRNRGNITDFTINNNISGRPYQKIAITNLCEHFNGNRRKGLLVMATGTGKTRVAISLVDVLTRNNWVKNLLFLADRTALVHQAKTEFEKMLPSQTICELSGTEEKDYNARLMFCTYQTMINYIDAEDKRFSIGRFDLIIIDEAHRSIFNKYGSIFNYFDSMLVGLTATPKEEVDANTYSVFGCESGMPNFDYTLEEAVDEGYLVPYKVINKTTSLFEHGEKYDNLSQEEKDQLEEYLIDIENPDPDVVATRPELFKKLYNKDTCKKILEDVMTYGIKVDTGQLLGKTIVFAYNHHHASMIVECFQEMYPQYSANYCQLIDNYVNYSEDLIEKFKFDDEFRLAVSVDMLDTGVDVPEVVNLVFFKPVKSKIKFMQMIGRGTRLSADLFGSKMDKTHFLIFDYCGNFEYFAEHPDGSDPKQMYSLTQKKFDVELDMLYVLQGIGFQANPYTKAYYDNLKKNLQKQVEEIKTHSDRISVRDQMEYVDKYCDNANWTSITAVMIKEMQIHLTPLIDSNITDNYKVVSFDVRMNIIELSILAQGNINSAKTSVKTVRRLAKRLIEEHATVPQVLAKKTELETLAGDDFWIYPSFKDMEDMRENVRQLMQFIDNKHNSWDVDIHDETEFSEVSGDQFGWIDIRTYREKVIDYLFENSNSAVIKKIKQLEPINNQDLEELEKILWKELGSREDYDKVSNSENVAAFVRSLVGMDQTVINKRFGEYLGSTILNSRQQEFIKTIINYVRENGDITKSDMLETAPFDNYDVMELFEGDISAVLDVVDTFHNCIQASHVS